MSKNGQLPPSQLTPIPPGRLENNAARAWNAGPARAGLKLLGPHSGYRNLQTQQRYWAKYQTGQGPQAAPPGTSNHGWGRAVDLAEPWMRTWIDKHGQRYGWQKTEAPNEWWHINYTGQYTPPKPSPLNQLTTRQRHAANRLLYHRRERRREATTGKGPRYKKHLKHSRTWKRTVRHLRNQATGTQKHILNQVLKDTNGRL
jgi:hypothetical protein